MKTAILAIGLGVFAAASPSMQTRTPTATGTTGISDSPTARASLTDGEGRSVGDARLRQTPHGVLVKVELRNVTPGTHAMHIHEVGRCDAPTFGSAGAHLAASGEQHGFFDADGPHAGDLPNLEVPAMGQLAVEHLVSHVTLDGGARPLFDADGSAIVIHAAEDDYKSDPSGNSGDRIACGRIVR